MRWFSRSELLLGEVALERLRASRVTVFGLGGVGSFAVEALARAGVGHLRLVDHDVVGPSKGILCVYSLEPADNKRPANPADIEPHRGPGRARHPVGTISYMPAIVGLKVAEEVLRMPLTTEPVP